MGLKHVFPALIALTFVIHSCTRKKSKSDIEIDFVQDTLQVGFTYWWPESGPFIGQCGEELSLVFSGTLTALDNVTDDAGPLYKSQKGTIEIDRVFKIKPLTEKSYANQKFVTTDCFDGLPLVEGDNVLVFCFDYEGDYTVPGNSSILKISDFDDPLIKSIREYIDSDENPIIIEKDTALWAKHHLDQKLFQIIDCKKEMQKAIQ